MPVIIGRAGDGRDPGQVLGMRFQGSDAAFQRLAGDVDAVGRPRVPAHEQPPHRMRLQALVEQFGEDPAVGRVAQRIHRGEARHPVIGLVQPDGELDVPGPGHHRVRLAAPDDAGNVTPQAQAVLEHAIRVIEELDLSDADRLRACDLLFGAQLARSAPGGLPSMPASPRVRSR